MTSTMVQQELYKLAVGLYNASPGTVYAKALASSIAAGASVAELYDALVNQASFQSQRPGFAQSASNAAFAQALVEHLVGDTAREADKSAMADYLVSMLPGVTRGAVLHLAVDLLDAVDEADVTWGEAAARLHNRMAAARYYTEDLGGDATELAMLQGTIAGVNADDATVAAVNLANFAALYPGVTTDPEDEPPPPELLASASNPALPVANAGADGSDSTIAPEASTPTVATASEISLAAAAIGGESTESPAEPDVEALAVAAELMVTVIDAASAGVSVVGGGRDTITGGAGNDTLEGGANADTLDGGIAAEVREFNFDGIADAVAGQTFDLNFMSQGNLTLTEAAIADTDYSDGTGAVVHGAGSDAFGAALATLLSRNLDQVNADWLAGGGDAGSVISRVSYSAITNLLTFTFDPGVNVATAIDLGIADADTGTFGVSAENTSAQGGTGGSDTFVIDDTDSGITLATADRVTGFDASDRLKLGLAGDDTAATGNYVEAGAAVAGFSAALTAANAALAALSATSAAAELYAFQFDDDNGYLFEDTDADGVANQVIVLVGIDNTEFAHTNIIG